MVSGASMVSKAQLEFKGPPDYWVTPKWLFRINKDGEFRPSVGLPQKFGEGGRNALGRIKEGGWGREAPEENFWRLQGGGGAKRPKKNCPQSW